MSNGQGNQPAGLPPAGLHVAIIMDGSGRWAEGRGLPRVEGHRAGRAAVRRTVAAAPQCGIRELTLFTFSTENWGRPKSEVAELMRVFEGFFCVDAPALVRNGIRVTVVGRRDRLPDSLREAIETVEAQGCAGTSIRRLTDRPREAERRSALRDGIEDLGEQSAAGERLHVRLAIDYSGRDAILGAARQFRQTLDPSPEEFTRLLRGSAGEAADIDLLIRTGGEQRLSNCPLWEIAYAELYFTPCLWPDFGPADLDAAVRDFRTRDRRFGRLPVMV
jgi:undecaprenyl diphosphate synthase